MKINCFPKHFLYLLALVVLFMPVYVAAQGDKQAANVYEQNAKLQERINYLEQKQNDLKERLDEKQAGFEKNVNNRFDLEQKQVNHWEFIVTVLIAVFGILVPISFTLFGVRWFKKEKEKINKSVKDAEDTCNAIKQHEKIAKQGADKIDETLQRISKEASVTEKKTNPQNIKDAQQILDDEKSSPYQKAWAEALVVYLTALQDKDKPDWQKALDKYQSLLNDYPEKITFSDLADVYFKMGYCNSKLGNVSLSYDYYNTATLLAPKFAEAWNNKGGALDTLGKYDEAIECYDRASGINSNDAEPCYNKGNVLFFLQRYEEAIHYYDKAIALKPELSEAWNNKGTALKNKGKDFYPEAEKCFRKAIDLDGTNETAKKNLVELLEKMNNDPQE